MNTGYTKPRQKVSSSLKGKKWVDESAEWYRGACVDAVDHAQALANYRLANGELDETEYLHVTNPLGTKKKELMGYPAKLMNYDIIVPNLTLLVGEKIRREFPPSVYARNSNHHNQLLEREQQLLETELQKRFINEVIAQGVELEEEQVTIQLEQIAAKIKNIPDMLASQGQDALEYIMDYNKLPTNFRNGFYDWLVNACVYSYKDVYDSKTCYEIMSPLSIAYLCSEAHIFINKGEAVRATHWMSVNEIYDRFQDADGFKGDLEKHLLDQSNLSSTGFTSGYTIGSTDIDALRGELFTKVFGDTMKQGHANGMRVDHVMWRSLGKYGILRIPDPFGNIEEIEVDDTYIPLEGDDIEWRWKDEIWENYCIDDEYWVGGQRVPIQNGSKADLLYNGRNMFTRHTRPKSLVERGRTYQKSVNIIKYRAEATLAKNLDKLILFPLGLIPNKPGWDVDKFMYYVRSLSFLFFDETKQNASMMIQAMKDLDVSSLQHVVQAYQLVEIVKNEWDQACGFTPQRKGQVGTSAGKGVTEQATAQSYVMSEKMFIEYEEFEREEYEGMLELSKYAFSDGIQAHFIRQDGTNAFLDLHDPESFLYADLGVFVKNGSREMIKLEMLKNQVTAFAQNAVDPKMISAIIEAGSFNQLHEVMDDLDAKMEARNQQQLAVQQEATASAERVRQEEIAFDYYDADLKSATDLQVALIQAGMQITEDMNKLSANGKGNSPEYGALEEGLRDNGVKLLQNATKLKEIAAKERMNKDDNKTALKNKTAGEK